MKKLGRKRSASSISNAESSANQWKIKENVKSTQSSGQTRISSFFGKASNPSSNKKTETNTKDGIETVASNSINKHVNSFRKRLSLGGKKASKVNILDGATKILDPVNEERCGVETNSDSPMPNENVNINNIHSLNNVDDDKSNDEQRQCWEKMSQPGKTSTPNSSRSFCGRNKLDISFESKIEKESITSNVVSIEDDVESRKRQKLSTSVEQLNADLDLRPINSNKQQLLQQNFNHKYQLEESVRTDFSITEFEFENSMIQDNKQESRKCDQKCDKSSTRNTENNFDNSIDEKELADAFDDDCFDLDEIDSNRVSHDKDSDKREHLPFTSTKKQPLSFYYGRHLVESVSISPNWGDLHLTVKRDTTSSKMKLSSRKNLCDNDEDVINGKLRDIVLRGSWAQSTKVKKGDVINILGLENELEDETELVIDDSSTTLVIVNPDMLMAGTSIVSTLFCMRKAVLSEWYKGIESSNRTMFIGTLLHDVLQKSLKNNRTSLGGIRIELDDCLKLPSVIQDMLSLKLNLDDIMKEVEPFLSHILFFIEKYVIGANVKPPAAAYSNTSNNNKNGSRNNVAPESWPGKVDEIQDIEENIWSPRLGIKGKVDLTLHVNLHKRDKQQRSSKTVPLELKTGRPSGSAEHRGQVILYSMMMSERWPDPQSGLLLYLRNSSLTEVQAGVHEIRGLVQLRNQLVQYITGRKDISEQKEDEKEDTTATLPDPINLKRACEQCSHLGVCTLYQKLDNKLPANPKHAMHELVPQTTQHLNEKELRFFETHSGMAQLERKEAMKFSRIKSLWCNTPAEREVMGNAIADLELSSCDYDENQNIGGHLHTFKRVETKDAMIPKTIFNIGELVMIGTEQMIALSQGTITSIDENCITIKLDRNLRELKVLKDKSNTFHIDRYEYSSGSSYNLVNLAKLMSNENSIATQLRDIVINQGQDTTFLKGLPREVATSPQAKAILRPLNKVQQKAVFKVMMAEQLVLLEGMPGCGKTTVIVALIRLLLTLGKSVLLTSYTHSAVDNVLLKMIEKEKLQPELSMPFLRLGKPTRIHSTVSTHSAENKLSTKSTDNLQKQLNELYSTVPLVATTCLGINHPAITARNKPFDYCILDEAAQCLLLSSLGPLFYSQKFVLVGDPHQLPPLVQSQAAKSQGMDISLFSHLATKPENIIPLTMQYRMNEKIQALANFLTYEGRLECGSDEVAKRTIKPNNRTSIKDEPRWITRLFNYDSIDNSVLFLNTDQLDNAMETTCDLGLYNPGEGDIVHKICKVFDSLYHSESNKSNDSENRINKSSLSIGVIAPYRAQVMHLRNKLNSINVMIDVNTVDQFQGQDKDVIIYSCTRSTPRKVKRSENGKVEEISSNDIMCDKRRLNVALTRAKSKLIIIGNGPALQSYEPFKNLLGYLESTDDVFQIKSMDLHHLEIQ